MKKTSHVHVDIAIFAVEVMKLSTEKERSEWLLSLMQSLVYGDPEKNSYGAFLLQEVETFKEKERERKNKFSKESALSKESSENPSYRTEHKEQNITEQSIKNIKEESKKNIYIKPDSINSELWEDFKKLRRAKKAPITHTAMNAVIREAEKAGMTLCEAVSTMVINGWTGFKAEWIKKQEPVKNADANVGSDIFDRIKQKWSEQNGK